MRPTRLLTLVSALSLLTAPLVVGHEERDVAFPPGDGEVPDYRTFQDVAEDGRFLVVCKPESAALVTAIGDDDLRAFNEHLLNLGCDAEHIQEAVNAVTEPGTNIYVLPGTYREEPSLAPPSPACQAIKDDVAAQGRVHLSYAEHVQCPHLQNLIAILGDDPGDGNIVCDVEPLCRLQIEGTGERPDDVIVDNAWTKLNALRADRADGFYLKNMLLQRTEFNSVYVMQTDGFVLDGITARWNLEYGILVFAVDHGLIKDCVAYGNGDAGLYPGSASDLKGVRWAVEITRCESFNNMAGYSGTAGNSVYVHDNDFHSNAAGVVMDSVFPDHPGLPQDSARFENNRIHANNVNHYDNFLGEDAPCHRDLPDIGIEDGVVCPTAPVPVGTGVMVAGGNDNTFIDNRIFDNWRYGTVLFTVPAVIRDELDPLKQLDTSHGNRQVGNVMGFDPDGVAFPNGVDFWWDEGGAGNCWQDNVAPGGITADPHPLLLPRCDDALVDLQRPPNPLKLSGIAPCALYSPRDNTHPAGCDWMTSPSAPGESGPSFLPAYGAP